MSAMNTRDQDGDAPGEHTGPSGRQFSVANSVPFCAVGAAQKRALSEKVLHAIANTPETSLVRVQSMEVAARNSVAIRVAAGNLIRLTLPAGAQVADINVWNAGDPNECFDSTRTREIHTSHLTTGDSLWTCMPYVRPILTITGDSINYGYDDDGAGVHDVVGSRCDPYTHAVMTGDSVNDTCHSNLVRAAVSQGLTEAHVHDVFNAFMCSGFSKDRGVYFVKPSPAKMSDYLDFFSHVDVIFAVSACRQGNLGTSCGDPTAEPTCYPLAVEVFQIPMQDLEGWSTPLISQYGGTHGLAAKTVI